jgi:SpoIID/LytB domain protein
MTIPLNSFVNTADDFIIKSIDTQEKDVLNKKNSLKYKSVLSPMFYKAEEKVFTTSGHTITKTDNNIVFNVKGYGHGVGMSQYGADYYARQGMTWQEIISHYYPNTQIIIYRSYDQ